MERAATAAERGLTRMPAVADSGDFSDVFAAHHADALRLGYLLCGDRDRAEDAVAEAFVKVYRRWRRGAVDQPGPYIRRAVVNEVNSRFRRLALERREARRRSGDERGVRSADEHVADSDAVLRALDRLPPRQRTAVVLRYYADLTEAEAAAAMRVSTGTVKSSVSRGLERMRRMLDNEVM